VFAPGRRAGNRLSSGTAGPAHRPAVQRARAAYAV